DGPTAFCLVPYDDYVELVDHINLLSISDENKRKLLKKLIPYPQNDPLANRVITYIRSHPDKFLAMIKNQDDNFL
ncbi:MAG: hypothetical protein UW76_C0012G0001, partial [Parcubacteria group bacterium GW2011_GWF2_44_8b]